MYISFRKFPDRLTIEKTNHKDKYEINPDWSVDWCPIVCKQHLKLLISGIYGPTMSILDRIMTPKETAYIITRSYGIQESY